MKSDRLFALIFRMASTIVIFWGLFVGSGLVSWPKALLFYTTQSNLAVLALFVYLSIRTGFDLITKGRRGNTCYHPRLTMALLMFISFTLIVFWSMLAPFLEHARLFRLGNLIVHALSPLLMMLEYAVFCERGRTKRHDTLLFALIPLGYVVFSCTLGALKVIFYHIDTMPQYFPYPFMDFYRLGMLALLPISAVAACYILLTHLLIRMDKKSASRAKSLAQSRDF